ncbi:MAG: DUF4249 domain-containing protein [Cyclobacteriaceae bacterium]
MKRLIPIILILSACELIIDVPRPDIEEKLILFSYFQPDSSFSAWITDDRYVLDDKKLGGISEVDLRLYEDNQLVGTFAERQPPAHMLEFQGVNNDGLIKGYYTLDYIAQPDKQYRIEASKPGYQSILAEASLTSSDYDFDVVGIDSIVHNETYYFEDGSEDIVYWAEYFINVEIDDPAGENFYLIDMYEDVPVIEYYFNPVLELYDYDSIVSIEIARQKKWFYGTGVLFDQQQFSGRHTILDDSFFDGKKYVISLITDVYNHQPRYPTEGPVLPAPIPYIEVKAISKEYFSYLKSLYIQQWNSGDPFTEPVSIYSNVENGYGVFAGFQTKIKQFEF